VDHQRNDALAVTIGPSPPTTIRRTGPQAGNAGWLVLAIALLILILWPSTIILLCLQTLF